MEMFTFFCLNLELSRLVQPFSVVCAGGRFEFDLKSCYSLVLIEALHIEK